MNTRILKFVGKAATVLVTVAGCASTPTASPQTTAPPAPAAATQAGLGAPPQGAGAGETFQPTVGQPGKDVVWVPTSLDVTNRMLDLAKLTPQDYVIDLGSGDGRNIIEAAKRGARGHGVEFNPDMVALSRRLAREAGVADRATFIEGDMYAADISKATVLALFLLPTNLEKLKDKFLALPPGTRIVLNTFTLDGWEPDVTSNVEAPCTSWCNTLLLVVPARVAGRWRVDTGEDAGTEVVLTQQYRNVTGSVVGGGADAPALTGKVSGPNISIEAGGTIYTGRVDGNRMSGTATGGGASRTWSATRVAD